MNNKDVVNELKKILPYGKLTKSNIDAIIDLYVKKEKKSVSA